jgi:hypothetical protein
VSLQPVNEKIATEKPGNFAIAGRVPLQDQTDLERIAGVIDKPSSDVLSAIDGSQPNLHRS